MEVKIKMSILEDFLGLSDGEDFSEYLRSDEDSFNDRDEVVEPEINYDEIDTIEELSELEPYQKLKAAKEIIKRNDPFEDEMRIHFPRLHRTALKALKYGQKGTKKRSKRKGMGVS